jgi:peptide/nickel transport system permease protein
MRAYIIRRLLLMIPTFIGITLVSFFMIQLAPGSPVYTMLLAGQGDLAADAGGQEAIQQWMEQYDMDEPLPVRYVLWLKKLFTLNLGTSMKDGRPVADKILDAVPITLELNIISIFLVYLISVPIGVYSATHHRSVSDNILTVVLFVLYSLPNFFVAMLLILYLGNPNYFDWFPIANLKSLGSEDWPFWNRLADHLHHLVLPVTCLTYVALARISRYARAGMLETIRQDYIRTARAYGFSEKVVVFKYALRNSIIPILTLLGTLLPVLIGGSVIIEQIFSIPGMGRQWRRSVR